MGEGLVGVRTDIAQCNTTETRTDSGLVVPVTVGSRIVGGGSWVAVVVMRTMTILIYFEEQIMMIVMV